MLRKNHRAQVKCNIIIFSKFSKHETKKENTPPRGESERGGGEYPREINSARGGVNKAVFRYRPICQIDRF